MKKQIDTYFTHRKNDGRSLFGIDYFVKTWCFGVFVANFFLPQSLKRTKNHKYKCLRYYLL